MHNYGQHGEQMHEFSWDENDQLTDKSSRELTTIERKTNEDIL